MAHVLVLITIVSSLAPLIRFSNHKLRYYFFVLLLIDPFFIIFSKVLGILLPWKEYYFFSHLMLIPFLPGIRILSKIGAISFPLLYLLINTDDNPILISLIIIFSLLTAYFLHSLAGSIRKEGFLYYYLIPLIITNVASIFYNYFYYTNTYYFTVSFPYWLLLSIALNLIIAYLGPEKKNRIMKQTNVLMNKENLDEKIKKQLTQKEQEVFLLLLQQKSNKEISKLLYVSSKTVESNLYNIKEKLDFQNVKELRKFIIAYKSKNDPLESSSKK